MQELKIVGQSPQRYDIPAKVDGSLKWAVDVKLPGMVHARNVKPPVAGAKLVSIDESSVAALPGFIKVVSKGNYVAVVCEREEQAINAAQAAQGELGEAGDRAVPGIGRPVHVHAQRDADVQLRTRPSSGIRTRRSPAAAKVIEAEYDIPFQGHTAFGPAHAMADPSNGQMTIYSNDMKSYGMRERRRDVSRHAARQRARRLDGRPAGLRPHRGRRCGIRSGVPGEGDRPAGARAVDAERGDGVGHEGAGVRVQDARGARRAGQPRRRSTTTRGPPTTTTSATTSPTRC